MSASPAGVGFLLERTEVHKSCKSLEVLLNILNDYCEAAGAVVTLEKRLAKALKDMASLKATTEIPSNTFTSCAAIFDALSEVDNKFAKLADKEYENAASDVKKWFKKLTKEERLHDERIENANARIKQAAQMYERKAKRSPRESAEEHTRYINLISSLGPELSQEKYNHAVTVSQRHAATTYTVAACISRIADAEWLRVCENVRKFSPTVGHLGEWRALCEGGWTGDIPQDLPQEGSTPGQQGQSDQGIIPVRDSEEPPDLNSRYDAQRLGENDESRKESFPVTATPPAESASYTPVKSSLHDDNTGSIRSLSAFPAPPTHIPPSPTLTRSNNGSHPTTSSVLVGSPLQYTDEPIQEDIRHTDIQRPYSHSDNPTPPTNPSAPLRGEPDEAGTESKQIGIDKKDEESRALPKDKPRVQEHERIGTNLSSESRVAAMRNRFTDLEAPRPKSPGLKDVPSLPLSVSGLANRYETGDVSSSPPPRNASPPVARRQTLPPLDTLTETARLAESMFRLREEETPKPVAEQPAAKEPVRAAREAVQIAKESIAKERKDVETDLKAREKRLQNMERDIRQRELELEHKEERQRRLATPPQAVRSVSSTYYNHDRSPHSPPRHSASSSHLGPPASPSQPRGSPVSRSPDRSPESSTRVPSSSEHAPFCGCDKCSVSKYKTTNVAPSPHDLRPPDKPFTLRPEKSKGWIRRLSMPVGHAFSLDSSRKSPSTANFAVSKTGGIGFSLDGRKNPSATQFPYLNEDGQLNYSPAGRKSHDAPGLGSKSTSMTNLAAMRR